MRKLVIKRKKDLIQRIQKTNEDGFLLVLNEGSRTFFPQSNTRTKKENWSDYFTIGIIKNKSIRPYKIEKMAYQFYKEQEQREKFCTELWTISHY